MSSLSEQVHKGMCDLNIELPASPLLVTNTGQNLDCPLIYVLKEMMKLEVPTNLQLKDKFPEAYK